MILSKTCRRRLAARTDGDGGVGGEFVGRTTDGGLGSIT